MGVCERKREKEKEREQRVASAVQVKKCIIEHLSHHHCKKILLEAF